ncbi:hypothetical protein KCU78_g7670, partial [Aureobasidium melanogenum]
MGTANESHVAAVNELNERHQAELQDFFEQSNNNQAQQQQSNDIVAQRPESSAISPSGGEQPEKRKADSPPAIYSAQTKRHKSAHHSPHYERLKNTHHWEPSKELVAALGRLMLPRAASSGFDTALVAYAQHYLWHLVDGFLWVGQKVFAGIWCDMFYRPVWDGKRWVGRLFRTPQLGHPSIQVKINSLDYYAKSLELLFGASKEMDAATMYSYLKDVWSYSLTFPGVRAIPQYDPPATTSEVGPDKFPSWALEKVVNKNFKLPDWASRYTDPASFTLYLEDVTPEKRELLPAEVSLVSNPVRYVPIGVLESSG